MVDLWSSLLVWILLLRNREVNDFLVVELFEDRVVLELQLLLELLVLELKPVETLNDVLDVEVLVHLLLSAFVDFEVALHLLTGALREQEAERRGQEVEPDLLALSNLDLVEILTEVLLARWENSLFGPHEVERLDRREERVESGEASDDPPSDLNEDALDTSEVSDEVHQLVDNSSVGNLINLQSEPDLCDSLGVIWIHLRVHIVAVVLQIVELIIVVFWHDKAIISRKVVETESIPSIGESIQRMSGCPYLIETHGKVLEILKVDLLVDGPYLDHPLAGPPVDALVGVKVLLPLIELIFGDVLEFGQLLAAAIFFLKQSFGGTALADTSLRLDNNIGLVLKVDLAVSGALDVHILMLVDAIHRHFLVGIPKLCFELVVNEIILSTSLNLVLSLLCWSVCTLAVRNLHMDELDDDELLVLFSILILAVSVIKKSGDELGQLIESLLANLIVVHLLLDGADRGVVKRYHLLAVLVNEVQHIKVHTQGYKTSQEGLLLDVSLEVQVGGTRRSYLVDVCYK